MENERFKKFESVYSKKVRAGKRRTYFFDVRKTKGEDFYLTLTESTKKFNTEEYERHKIFLYKEDFNRFLSSLEEAINFVKTELMPDYNYEEFDNREDDDYNPDNERSPEGNYPRNRDRDRGSRDSERAPRRQFIVEDANDDAPKGNDSAEEADDAIAKSDDDISW